jgi:hypothetical protein
MSGHSDSDLEERLANAQVTGLNPIPRLDAYEAVTRNNVNERPSPPQTSSATATPTAAKMLQMQEQRCRMLLDLRMLGMPKPLQ